MNALLTWWRKRFPKRFTVVITYKSGVQRRIRTTTFKVVRTNGEITEVEWGKIQKFKPLYIGINNIESVWQE